MMAGRNRERAQRPRGRAVYCSCDMNMVQQGEKCKVCKCKFDSPTKRFKPNKTNAALCPPVEVEE